MNRRRDGLVCIEVNDIFDELSQENLRLNTELSFANKCINVFIKVNKHLIRIHEKYQKSIDWEDKQEFNDLTQELKSIRSVVKKNEINTKEVVTKTLKPKPLVRKSHLSTNHFLNKRLVSLKFNEDLRKLCMTHEEREQCFDRSTKTYNCPKPLCTYKGLTNKTLYHHLYLSHRKPDILCSYPGCKRLFRTTTVLKEHLSRHLGIKPFSCGEPDCDYKTSTKCSLKLHALSHSEVRPHKCTMINCDKAYKSLTTLNHHLQQHSKPKPTPVYLNLINNCHKLKAQYRSESCFDNQIITEDNNIVDINESNSNLEDIYESYDQSIEESLTRIKKISKNSKKFKVKPEPNETKGPKSDTLLDWMLTREEREQCFDPITNSYKCPKLGCNSICSSSRRLYHHFYSSHREPNIRCEFPGCDRAFRNTSSLSEHLKKHFNIKPFVCDFDGCEYRSTSRNNLNIHKKSHSNMRSFKCNFDGCPKSFKTDNRLKEHMYTHSPELHFKCPFEGCAQSFQTSARLLYHKNKYHLGKTPTIKLYQCDWPGCDFKGKSLVSHKLAHTGEKPFRCDWPLCGKRFRLKSTLKDHRNIHENSKPYVCHWPGCGYRCSNSGNLRKHVVHCHNGNAIKT